jgi:NADH-quinone oxidoreductase subunit A
VAQYLPIVALAVLAVVFAALSRVASQLLAPNATTVAKRSAYECGIVPGRETLERFPVRFYLIAMIFIVFDIEIIFLYPWAVIYRDLGGFGLVEVMLFTVSVLVSFVYLLSNGALDWGPAMKQHRLSPMVSADRTTLTTVKRVGLDGREGVEPDPDEEHEAA